MSDIEYHKFRPLFHGSDSEIEPGEVIGPRTKKVAHAAPYIATARIFGKHVYEVEPVNPERTWSQQMKYTGNQVHHEVLSEEGFRVVRKVPKSRRDSYYDGKRVMKSQASQIIFKSDAMMERITLQRKTYNQNRIEEYAGRGVPYIEFHSSPDCCKYCDNLYKGKKFPLPEFLKNLRPDGTNQGLLKSQWSPYVYIAHPWCRCRPVAVYG